jgi:PEP-CTERM motif
LKSFRLVAGAAFALASASSAHAQIILKFDDVLGATTSETGVLLGSYYNGGGGDGVNFGVEFLGTSWAYCLNRPGLTDCSNTSWGSGSEAIAAEARGTRGASMALGLGGVIINRSAGFSGGFSFFFTNPFAVSAGLSVWSGVNGTGTLLATWSASTTPDGRSITGCFGVPYCPFVAAGVGFDGVARSVTFTGAYNFVGFDDLTLGSVTPGVPSVVPEPTAYALMATGLIGMVGLRRRNGKR